MPKYSPNIHVLDLEKNKIKEFKSNYDLVEFINDLVIDYKTLARDRFFFCANSEQARNVIHALLKKGAKNVKA